MIKVMYQPRFGDPICVARFHAETDAQEYLEKIKEVRPKAYPYHRIELATYKGKTI